MSRVLATLLMLRVTVSLKKNNQEQRVSTTDTWAMSFTKCTWRCRISRSSAFASWWICFSEFARVISHHMGSSTIDPQLIMKFKRWRNYCSQKMFLMHVCSMTRCNQEESRCFFLPLPFLRRWAAGDFCSSSQSCCRVFFFSHTFFSLFCFSLLLVVVRRRDSSHFGGRSRVSFAFRRDCCCCLLDRGRGVTFFVP